MRFIHTGSCHCGRLSVHFETGNEPTVCIPRACQCSFCQKHAAAYLSDPQGKIVIATSSLSIDTYKMGLGITDFHVCHNCGVLLAATWADSDGSVFAVVNVRVLDQAAAFTSEPLKANFDGEEVSERETRRRRAWTPASIIMTDR